jgi:hypothetical protein
MGCSTQSNLKTQFLSIVMTTIANLLITPVVSLNRRFRGRFASSALDTPPPPVSDTKQWEFGRYCWKATVEALDKDGIVERTFIGYSQNMDITTRTQVACDRFKQPGTVCGEVMMVMKGGDCDEVIFMKQKTGTIRNL